MGSFPHMISALTLTGLVILVAAYLDALPALPVLVTYLGVAAAGVGVLALPFAQDAISHRAWLRKREKHARRMTEVLVPPKGMASLEQTFQLSGKKRQQELEAFAANYQKKAHWRVLALSGLILFVFALYVSVSFSFSANLLEGFINLFYEEASLQAFAGREAFYTALLATVVLGLGADGVRQEALKTSEAIQGREPEKMFTGRFVITLITFLAGGGIFATFSVIDIYASSKAATAQQVEKIETKAETLEREQKELVEKQDFLAKENARLNKELQGKASEVKALKEKTAGLEKQHDSAKEKIKTLEKKLRAQQQKTEQAEKRLAAVQSEQAEVKTNLREELTQLKNQQKAMENKLDEAQSALETARERLRITQGTLSATQEEHDVTKAILNKWQRPLPVTDLPLPAGYQVVADGQRLRLSTSALFTDQDAGQLSGTAADTLAPLAKALKQLLAENPQAWVVVMAHANALPVQTGAYDNKLTLTAVQAAAIKDVLNQAGVKPVLAAGFGHQRELDSRLVEEALQKNNRVEFAVVQMPL